ncbi:MAG TPA: hypothetical protein VHE35_17230 [Kofleriaceae bacterium]|nr:hypothetical protein [Kofleriaceae bacterium]
MRTLVLLSLLGGLLAIPSVAAAQTACTSLPDPIYIAGSSAVQPMVIEMAKVLSAQAAPVTLVYQKQGSCTGVNAIVLDTTPAGACANGACIRGTANYYDAAGASHNCDLAASGTHVDVGVSDVFVDTCTGLPPPAGVKNFQGPVQVMLMVVPKASTQTAITAEEAYFVFGYGMPGRAMPWINESLMFVRNALSGTQQMISHTINVPAARWKGMDMGGSQQVLDAVSASAMPEATIGIISADFYDIHRDTLTALAFQTYGQKGAYFPDSTATSFDKQNVRDGHYVIWGALELVAHVDGSGVLNTPAAKRFVDWVTGNTGNGGTPAPFDMTAIAIKAHTIPKCAMKVQRSSEAGALSPFTPATDCTQTFLQMVGQ